MAAPEVKFVLDAIKDHWPGSETALSDVPLERVDRDNSDVLDSEAIHEHAASLEGTNLVGARSTSWSDTPIDPDYNVETERIVGVRVEGLHVSEYGAIDPRAGSTTAASRDYPTTTWDSLKTNIRGAIYSDDTRTFPDVSDRPTIGFKDLFIENWSDDAANYADYYQLDFDVRYVGFEEL